GQTPELVVDANGNVVTATDVTVNGVTDPAAGTHVINTAGNIVVGAIANTGSVGDVIFQALGGKITRANVDTSWSAAANLSTARDPQTATLLATGKILVVGGQGRSALSSAELYAPATNTWSAAAAMSTARQGQTATLLANGKVLVTGGIGSTSAALSSAE